MTEGVSVLTIVPDQLTTKVVLSQGTVRPRFLSACAQSLYRSGALKSKEKSLCGGGGENQIYCIAQVKVLKFMFKSLS